VNLLTEFHTQAIEMVWKEDERWLQRAGHQGSYLQKHLDEVSWRAYRRNHPSGAFGAMLEDTHTHFSREVE